MHLSITLVSGGLLMALFALFTYENSRGARFFGRFRDAVDRILERSVFGAKAAVPSVNNKYIKQLFHYLTHCVLSTLLRVVHTFGESVERAMRHNRVKAHSKQPTAIDTHLHEVVEHKKSSVLSMREKQKRMNEALLGK